MSKQIEKSLLGGLILNSKYYFQHSRLLKKELFTTPLHQSIFSQIEIGYSKAARIDKNLLVHGVSQSEPFTFDKLMAIIDSANPSGIDDYIQVLTQTNQRNELHITVSQAKEQLLGGADPIEIQASLTADIDKIFVSSEDAKTGHVSELFQPTLDQILLAQSSDGLSGIDTGFDKLNNLTGGWQSSDLIILGARPGMGKTTLAINFLLKAAETGTPSVFYSLEMSSTQIMQTIINIKTGISIESMRNGNLTNKETETIAKEFEAIRDLPLFIFDNRCTIESIVTQTRYLKRKYGIKFVVIDYLQLITSKLKTTNINAQMEHISRQVKLLASASDCNINILALSQLSRSVETRGGDKKPMLSDIRSSGAIEQDADSVMFVYRESYYDFSDSNEVELIIAKNRHGRIGKIDLLFENRSFVQNDNNFNSTPTQFPVSKEPSANIFE